MIEADRYRIVDNPLGRFVIALRDDGELCTGWLEPDHANAMHPAKGESALLDELADRLRRYFAGEAVSFEDAPLPKGTDFQRACRRACQAIPLGQTRSYGQLAAAAGSSIGAARAAGQAMRNNPVPILVPCHRVVATDGRLHGFSGQTDPAGHALWLKARLLELEGVVVGMFD